MIKLYKKEDDKKVEIENLGQIDKPFFICLDENDNVTNTSIIKKENNTKIDIIGIDYFDDSNTTKAEEIVNEIILPFISEKKENQLNFIATDKYTVLYKLIESVLKFKLQEKNYSYEEINSILSKLTFVSLLSNVDTSDLKSNSIVFIDVNNENTKSEFTEDYKKMLKDNSKDSLVGNYGSENNVVYIHNGTGDNNYSEYLNNTKLQIILSYILEKTFNKENKSINEIFNILNGSETIEDSSKYIFSFPKQKTEIDIALETTNEIIRLYKNEEKERKRLEELTNKLIANIKEYSSETTYNQILMASGILGFEDPNFLNKDSDKKVRRFYDEIMSEVDEDMKNNTK